MTFWNSVTRGFSRAWRWLWTHEAVRTAFVLQAVVTGLLAWTVQQEWVPGEIATAVGLIAVAAINEAKRGAVYSQSTVDKTAEEAATAEETAWKEGAAS